MITGKLQPQRDPCRQHHHHLDAARPLKMIHAAQRQFGQRLVHQQQYSNVHQDQLIQDVHQFAIQTDQMPILDALSQQPHNELFQQHSLLPICHQQPPGKDFNIIFILKKSI